MSAFLFGRAEWSAGPAKAGNLSESSEKWDVGHQRRRDRCKCGAPESSVEENLPDEKGLRGNGAREVFCDGAIRCCQHAQPLSLPVVPQECIRTHTWAPWSVAAFSGASSYLSLTSVCVLRHLGGACWIFKEIHWPKMSWSGRERRFRRVLLWYGTASIRLQRTWSVTKLVWSTLSCRSWQRCPVW